MIETINTLNDLQFLAVQGHTDFKQWGEVNATVQDNLILFNYTAAAQYLNRWNYFERISRGLILDRFTGHIVARPFDKFHNYDDQALLPYPHPLIEATEKMDGSLGILYRNPGYRIATRGSFTSDQARWATAFIDAFDLSDLDPELTLLFEIIYPENRVVVDYGGREDLVLIGARNRFTGYDLWYRELKPIAEQFGFSLPTIYKFDSLDHVVQAAKRLTANSEGWVLRFGDGERFKVKGEAYRLAHKLLTGISFKTVLEAVQAGTLAQMLEGVPDEFLTTIKQYQARIEDTVEEILWAVDMHYNRAPTGGTRKEFVVYVFANCPDYAKYMFAKLDGHDLLPIIYKNAFKRTESE
jgi:RNA ligase